MGYPELTVAQAALMEVGLGDVSAEVRIRTRGGVPFPVHPHALRPEAALVRKAFVLAHQVHDRTAHLDEDGYVECDLCDSMSRDFPVTLSA